MGAEWRSQITTTLKTTAAMVTVNTISIRCHHTIVELRGRFLDIQDFEALIPAPFPAQPPIGLETEMNTAAT